MAQAGLCCLKPVLKLYHSNHNFSRLDTSSKLADTHYANCICIFRKYQSSWPVITSDAGSTGSCWLFTLLIIMGIHMSFLSLLLQDLSKFIFADAPEESCSFVRFLNHPLQIGRRRRRKKNKPQNKYKVKISGILFLPSFLSTPIFNSVPTFWLIEHLYAWSKKHLVQHRREEQQRKQHLPLMIPLNL